MDKRVLSSEMELKQINDIPPSSLLESFPQSLLASQVLPFGKLNFSAAASAFTMMQKNDKLALSLTLKEKGNNEFKEGNYKAALRWYYESLLYVKGLDTRAYDMFAPPNNGYPIEKVPNKIEDTLFSLYLNMAACYLKLNEYHKAIQSCENVIKAKKDPKAFYRRALARIGLNELDSAEADLKTAVSVAPNDIGIRNELAAVREKLKERQKQADEELKSRLSKG